MKKNFNDIKQKYEEFYQELMKKGRLPIKDTGVGFWGAAVIDEVFEIFNKIELGKFKHLLDIGSGDGKVVMIASLFGVKATGVELDQELFKKSMEIKNHFSKRKHAKNVEFHNKNYYEHDFTPHDILFINPDIPFHRGLENKLLREMKGKLLLYGSHYYPSYLKKEQSFAVNGTEVSVYSKF
ncbi:class I SAM-dependent methyltransferase [Candidatus Woesearchaeota archaeon]|nr:class I SAM-dependent methyltransferase [Candidatus Woesearchaeota archaeon]